MGAYLDVVHLHRVERRVQQESRKRNHGIEWSPDFCLRS